MVVRDNSVEQINVALLSLENKIDSIPFDASGKGEKGEKGDKGDPGPRGPAGPQGPKGEDASKNLVDGTAEGSLQQVSCLASGSYSFAEGSSNSAVSSGSHAEGINTVAGDTADLQKTNQHAEGAATKALGHVSHAEGYLSESQGLTSHAEGWATKAVRDQSHSEGTSTIASGVSSHAEGTGSTASGNVSHSEGQSTVASGAAAHSEGESTVASGDYSHAAGNNTTAKGFCSTAIGQGTIASGNHQLAMGYYNVEHPNSDRIAFVIGNGLPAEKEDIFTVDWGGNIRLKGDYFGSASKFNGLYIWDSFSTTDSLIKTLKDRGGFQSSSCIVENGPEGSSWYNYIWIPHRNGDPTMAGGLDNNIYGSLILTNMTNMGNLGRLHVYHSIGDTLYGPYSSALTSDARTASTMSAYNTGVTV